jgi:MFS family permease
MLPVLYSLITAHAPIERRGGIMGIASSMSILAGVVGPVTGGLVVGQFGFRPAFAVASLVFVGALPLALRSARATGAAGASAGAGNARARAGVAEAR